MNVWCEALERATQLQLPWRVLREKLAPGPVVIKPNGVTYVDYESTLELLDTDIVVSGLWRRIMMHVETNWFFESFESICVHKSSRFQMMVRVSFRFKCSIFHWKGNKLEKCFTLWMQNDFLFDDNDICWGLQYIYDSRKVLCFPSELVAYFEKCELKSWYRRSFEYSQ